MFLLFVIFLVVFSIIGANIYGKINFADYPDYWQNVNSEFNLDSFYTAFLLNYRNSGESWPYVMKEYADVNPDIVGHYASYCYFILCNFICFVVLVNLFLLIVLQEYFEFQNKGENPIEKFETIHETFTKTWNKFSEIEYQGFKMSVNNFYKFLYELATLNDWELSKKLTNNGKFDFESINNYLSLLELKKYINN